MERSDYAFKASGRIEEDHFGDWPHGYFMPSDIPREPALTLSTQRAVSQAQLALGKVAGLSLLITNPEVLLAPSMVREALSSSRIEGTQASLSEVLSADSAKLPLANENLREVNNYLKALKQGTELLDSLPITGRLFCHLHKTLMTGVRGEEKYPGEFRRTPVWIGSPGATPGEARFIPPLPYRISELISDLEVFVNNDHNLSPVVRAALMHYQFETIHPFLDGNGRIGRLLISLLLINDSVLASPVLTLSSYFERTRGEYYERLQGVRELGQLDEWIRFFAVGVEAQANETATRIAALLEIQNRYRNQALASRSSIGRMVDLLFSNPVITSARIQEMLEVSQPTAAALIKQAAKLGWLTRTIRSGRGGREYWYAQEIWTVTTDEIYGE